MKEKWRFEERDLGKLRVMEEEREIDGGKR